MRLRGAGQAPGRRETHTDREMSSRAGRHLITLRTPATRISSQRCPSPRPSEPVTLEEALAIWLCHLAFLHLQLLWPRAWLAVLLPGKLEGVEPCDGAGGTGKLRLDCFGYLLPWKNPRRRIMA